MKNFKFTINGNSYNVEVKDFDNNMIDIEVNGTPYKVEVNQEIKAPKTPKLVRAVVPEDRKGVISKSTSGVHKVIAPLPGTILKVNVSVGQAVAKGENLMIMEAMKMENNVLSEQAGTIKSIAVKAGDVVLQNDVLIEIE